MKITPSKVGCFSKIDTNTALSAAIWSKKHNLIAVEAIYILLTSKEYEHYKSVNLEYDMLVRWANGTNVSSTKRLMF